MQTITRKGTFDAAHRVLNERFKCFNVHGHTYLYELTFSFETMEDIGYAIDFKEIKRVAMQWIDDMFDHGAILNYEDRSMLATCNETKSKRWIMSLNGETTYCNPTVENVAKEIFLGVQYIMRPYKGLMLKNVRLYETPNCFTDCHQSSISPKEKDNFFRVNLINLSNYSSELTPIEYDDRKETK